MLLNYHINKKNGFTLIEIISVITILGLLSVVGVNIVTTIVKGKANINLQSSLLVDAQFIVDRIKKQLQVALPNSYRISNGDRCLSFFPVVADGFYLNTVPDSSNTLPEDGRNNPLAISPYRIMGGNAVYISIGTETFTEVYGNNPSSLALISSLSPTSVTLNQNHRWQRNSLSQSYFIVDNPQAFCVVGDELQYFPRISQSSSQVDLSRDNYVLITGVNTSSGSPFALNASASNCEGCLDLSLTFNDGDSQVVKEFRVFSFYEK